MIVSSDSLPCDPHPVIWTDNWSTSPISRIEDRRSSRRIRHRRPRMAMATSLLLCSSILTFSCFSNIKFCMKDRRGFLFVRYKRHCCTELVCWEHTACLFSGIKKRPLVGGWLNTTVASRKYAHPPLLLKVIAKGHLLLESTPTQQTKIICSDHVRLVLAQGS